MLKTVNKPRKSTVMTEAESDSPEVGNRKLPARIRPEELKPSKQSAISARQFPIVWPTKWMICWQGRKPKPLVFRTSKRKLHNRLIVWKGVPQTQHACAA